MATAGLAALLLHQSHESPVIFHRYSVPYSVLLLLAAINVFLLWRRPTPSLRPVVAAFVLALSGAIVWDFLSGLQWLDIAPIPVNIFLLGIIVVKTGLYDRLRNAVGPRYRVLFISLPELALIMFSLMFVIVLSEVGLRLFLLERLTPKTHREFENLMSDRWPRPIEMNKPAGTIRIAGLADSMGVVGGPSENYYYLLEDHLRLSGLPVEMMNVSVSGNEPRHELSMLKLAMAYEPDLILHSFFIGNDFTLFGEDTFQVRGVRINNREDVSRFVPRNFFLVDYIFNSLVGFHNQRRREEELRTGAVKQMGHLSRHAFFGLEVSRLPLFRPSQQQVMSEVFPILDAIRETAAGGNARYALIINPDQIQVDDNLRAEVLQASHFDENEFIWDFPQQLLHSYCESRWILCLDLLPLFRATGRSGALYTIRDGHYSLEGNQTAAEAIYTFLQEKNLMDQRLDLPESRFTEH